MVVKSKNLQVKNFNEISSGTVFRYENELFMRVFLEDDYIVCPRCSEDIYAGKELGGLAVCLETGDVYRFDERNNVEVIVGAFVEE